MLGRTFTTLPILQTLIVEVEAVLNDRPLTYLSSDIKDLQPLTPSNLIYGHRIVMLPHLLCEDDETTDESFQIGGSDTLLRRRAKTQALLMKHFWVRWKQEYLTSLREFHRTTGRNDQNVNVGEVVLIHDDIPRVHWKLAVIKEVVKGKDGLIRSAVIRTANGITNRPITKLYPMEITATVPTESAPQTEQDLVMDNGDKQDEMTGCSTVSARKAATRARERLSEWSQILGAPPEDVEETD